MLKFPAVIVGRGSEVRWICWWVRLGRLRVTVVMPAGGTGLTVRTGFLGNAASTNDRTSAAPRFLKDDDGVLLRDRMLGIVLGLSLATDALWDAGGGAWTDTCRTF